MVGVGWQDTLIVRMSPTPGPEGGRVSLMWMNLAPRVATPRTSLLVAPPARRVAGGSRASSWRLLLGPTAVPATCGVLATMRWSQVERGRIICASALIDVCLWCALTQVRAAVARLCQPGDGEGVRCMHTVSECDGVSNDEPCVPHSAVVWSGGVVEGLRFMLQRVPVGRMVGLCHSSIDQCCTGSCQARPVCLGHPTPSADAIVGVLSYAQKRRAAQTPQRAAHTRWAT